MSATMHSMSAPSGLLRSLLALRSLVTRFESSPERDDLLRLIDEALENRSTESIDAVMHWIDERAEEADRAIGVAGSSGAD